jgi:hypothetical protein
MLDFSTRRTVTVSGPALPVSPIGEPALQLSAIGGRESLSEIYTYTLDCLTPLSLPMPEQWAANLDLKAMIGKELTVTVQLDGMGSFVAGMRGMSGAANIGQGFIAPGSRCRIDKRRERLDKEVVDHTALRKHPREIVDAHVLPAVGREWIVAFDGEPASIADRRHHLS